MHDRELVEAFAQARGLHVQLIFSDGSEPSSLGDGSASPKGWRLRLRGSFPEMPGAVAMCSAKSWHDSEGEAWSAMRKRIEQGTPVGQENGESEEQT